MSYAFNNIKEEARCRGDIALSDPTRSTYQNILKKYKFPAGSVKFIFKECVEGQYRVFKTPDNLKIIVGDKYFGKLFQTKSNIKMHDLRINDIYTIKTPNYSGLLEYKSLIDEKYYVFQSSDGMEYILSGNDVDGLTVQEKEKLLGK